MNKEKRHDMNFEKSRFLTCFDQMALVQKGKSNVLLITIAEKWKLHSKSQVTSQTKRSSETTLATSRNQSIQNMEFVKIFIVLILIFLFKYSSNSGDASDEKAQEIVAMPNLASDISVYKKPSLVVCSLIRNKAHTLPMFLTYLEEQDYPKDRISLWLVTDHNEDNSREILEAWLNRARNLYHSVHYQFNDSKKLRKGETNLTHWPEERFLELIRMKEEALTAARRSWADYVFVSMQFVHRHATFLHHSFHMLQFIDADVFLTLSTSLSLLVSLNRAIVAPMLASDGLYSNFW